MKATYHFMTGQVAVTKTFEADTKATADVQAVEFGKSKKGVVRIQCDATRKHIWESDKTIKQATADPEAALDIKADPDAVLPTPSGAAVSTTIGVAAKVASTFLLMLCLLVGINAKAYTVVGVAPASNVPVVSSYTISNNVVVANTNTAAITGTWPGYIAAGTTVTNVTPVSSTGLHQAFQFTAAANQTNGGNVIIQLARNLQGGAITNAQGTGMNLDLFATVTNTLPINTATSLTTTCELFGPVNNQGYIGDGAIPNMYIYSITTPANVTLTNYQIYSSTQ